MSDDWGREDRTISSMKKKQGKNEKKSWEIVFSKQNIVSIGFGKTCSVLEEKDQINRK